MIDSTTYLLDVDPARAVGEQRKVPRRPNSNVQDDIKRRIKDADNPHDDRDDDQQPVGSLASRGILVQLDPQCHSHGDQVNTEEGVRKEQCQEACFSERQTHYGCRPGERASRGL